MAAARASAAAATPARPLAVRAPRALRHPPAHPVRLNGLRAGTTDKAVAPLIVERRDADFVAGLLADLGDRSRHAAVRAATPAASAGVLRVFQPVQRVFNLVVMEAFCDIPGQPRVDPAHIDSAGFVLRRVADGRHLAWLKAGARVFGWEAVDEDLDPAADRRQGAVSLGHPALDARAPSLQRVRSAGSARLAGAADPVGEDVQPLFVAPPDVCAGGGRTLLFGTLRIAPGELAETPATPPVFGSDAAERDLLRADLVSYLKAGGARALPLAGRRFTTEDVARALRGESAALTKAEYDALAPVVLLLQQLHLEFGAFGDGAPAASLRAGLQGLTVQYGSGATATHGSAWAFLTQARAVLLDAVPQAALTMPHAWGAVGTSAAEAIFEATLACLQRQFAQALPAPGRFDAPGSGAEARYVVRAFVRLKPAQPGCAGRLVWSGYSAPFTIAPWYESSGAPVPVIPMPDLMDRAQLSKVKPNVAFRLPPKLAQLLRGKPEDLMEGKGDGGNGLGLGWICSFSLPIITLCAFIVLNIFLQLLNLIFFWLPFLKICLPVPKAKD